MDDKERIAIAGTALVIGYVVGSRITRKAIFNRLEQRRRLIANGLVSVLQKAREENLTPEQFQDALYSELEFIKIVTK